MGSQKIGEVFIIPAPFHMYGSWL